MQKRLELGRTVGLAPCAPIYKAKGTENRAFRIGVIQEVEDLFVAIDLDLLTLRHPLVGLDLLGQCHGVFFLVTHAIDR